jgi:ABC-type transport system involved in multi-copper enzyme maturation permease subunit
VKQTASTHQEIYRRFEGELAPHPVRWWPLFRSQVRVNYKRKLPLLLLYAGPAIASIVMSFVVYGKFTFEAQMEDQGAPSMGLDAKAAIAVAVATQASKTMLEVRNLIAMANIQIQAFALLVIAWFGAGLIAEDKKLGAQLLYFSRPLTRLDYFLGHFMTVSWFGLMAIFVPGLVISIVATFTSPEYTFIKEQWDVPLAAAGYAFVTVALLSSLTLAISSVVPRKSFALVGLVGLVAGSEAVGGMLSGLMRDENFMLVGIWNNLVRIGDWMFSLRGPAGFGAFDWPVGYSFAVVGGLIAASLGVCWLRLRKMEGVG